MTEDLQTLLPPEPLAAEFDVDSVAEVLHEQTKFHRASFAGQVKAIVRYLHHPAYIARGAAGHNVFAAYPRIALPEPATDLGSLAQALAARRSTRKYEGSVSLRDVSGLLHHAVRVNRYATSNAAPQVKLAFRPYPSPGGLYPTEFYLFLNDVEGVEPCIAHYDARDHCLRVLKAQDGEAFSTVEIQGGEATIRAPLALALTCVPQRATAKYGPRGYRMALLEAGHAAQNLCLAAQGLGLGSLVYGAYFDDELAALLDADGVTETVVSVLLFGREAA